MGNSIWLRLLLLLSEKSTCFICMRGLQTEEEVEQGRSRQGRPKLSWNRRGAKQRQSWNRSGRNSDACEARFDKFVKIAAATVTEESAEERAKGNKWRRWWWLKWSWRWLRKICWQNICNFRKSSENIFCLSSETRRGKMFTAQTSRQQVAPNTRLPLPTTLPSPLPAAVLNVALCVSPCPVYQSLFPPLPFLGLIDFCGSNVQF